MVLKMFRACGKSPARPHRTNTSMGGVTASISWMLSCSSVKTFCPGAAVSVKFW